MLDKHEASMDIGEADIREAKRWLFEENIRLKQQKEEIEGLKTQLEKQQRDFRLEQNRTADRNKSMKRQLEQEKRLFEMKWKLLETELMRLAEDKKRMEQERKEYQSLQLEKSSQKVHYEMFFVGVNNKLTLKKRYKDLIKIFHPDNVAGDKTTLQEINREYDTLKNIFV